MDSFKMEDWRFDSLPTSKAADSFDPKASIFTCMSIDITDGSLKFNCKVCGHAVHEAYTVAQMDRHCKRPQHSRRVQLLLNVKEEILLKLDHRLATTNTLAPRVEQLGLLVWKDKIQSHFYQWIHSIGLTPNNFVFPASHFLEKYERMEISSLIELAAWKHACLMAGEDDTESSLSSQKMLSSYLDMKEWERNGWKKNKAAMRRSEATEVIVPNVLAFIDDSALPTESNYSTATNKKRRRESSWVAN
jgi:hypothetical protein